MGLKSYKFENNKRITYILEIPVFTRFRSVYATGGGLSMFAILTKSLISPTTELTA